MLERTLILVKPDGVRRSLTGQILARLERSGLKIVALKMLHADRSTAEKHYTYEDIAVRHGEKVHQMLLDFITEAPIVAAVLEGVSAVENVRKLTGATEPKFAAPGTIRGDYCHHGYDYCTAAAQPIRNVIHASATPPEAAAEIAVWFAEDEILTHRRNDEKEHF